MCMKDTDLLIENNVQPFLVFRGFPEEAGAQGKSGILLR